MFRFSIRELMLVTLVAGLALGWWIDRSQLSQWQREGLFLRWQVSTLKEQVGHIGGTVYVGERSISGDYKQPKNISSSTMSAYYFP